MVAQDHVSCHMCFAVLHPLNCPCDTPAASPHMCSGLELFQQGVWSKETLKSWLWEGLRTGARTSCTASFAVYPEGLSNCPAFRELTQEHAGCNACLYSRATQSPCLQGHPSSPWAPVSSKVVWRGGRQPGVLAIRPWPDGLRLALQFGKRYRGKSCFAALLFPPFPALLTRLPFHLRVCVWGGGGQNSETSVDRPSGNAVAL